MGVYLLLRNKWIEDNLAEFIYCCVFYLFPFSLFVFFESVFHMPLRCDSFFFGQNIIVISVWAFLHILIQGKSKWSHNLLENHCVFTHEGSNTTFWTSCQFEWTPFFRWYRRQTKWNIFPIFFHRLHISTLSEKYIYRNVSRYS